MRRRRVWLGASLALVPATALVLLWLSRSRDEITLRGGSATEAPPPATVVLYARSKASKLSQPSIRVAGELPGSGEARVSMGDYLLFGLRGLRAPTHVRVSAVDEHGRVHDYVGDTAVAPEPGPLTLGRSIDLSRAHEPGRLRLVALFSEKKIDDAAVRAAVARLDAPRTDRGPADEAGTRLVTGLVVIAAMTIPGAARIAAVAFAVLAAPGARAGKTAAAPLRAGSDVYAVVVGYNGAQEGLPALRFADDDAVRFSLLLSGFAPGGAALRVALLTRVDDETRAGLSAAGLAVRPAGPPTRTALQAAMAEVGRALAARPPGTPPPTFYFVYAGHGLHGRILLEPEVGATAGLTGHELRAAVAELGRVAPGLRSYLFLDACRSQSLFTERGDDAADALGPDLSAEVAALERRAEAVASTIGVLTAASAGQSAGEVRALGAGYFSHVLASGIAGAADADGDERVTFAELAAFVAYNTDRLGAQRPWFAPPGGQLAAPVVDLRGARGAARALRRARRPLPGRGRGRAADPRRGGQGRASRCAWCCRRAATASCTRPRASGRAPPTSSWWAARRCISGRPPRGRRSAARRPSRAARARRTRSSRRRRSRPRLPPRRCRRCRPPTTPGARRPARGTTTPAASAWPPRSPARRWSSAASKPASPCAIGTRSAACWRAATSRSAGRRTWPARATVSIDSPPSSRWARAGSPSSG